MGCLDWSYYPARRLEWVRGSACSHSCLLVGTGERLERRRLLSWLLFPRSRRCVLWGGGGWEWMALSGILIIQRSLEKGGLVTLRHEGIFVLFWLRRERSASLW